MFELLFIFAAVVDGCVIGAVVNLIIGAMFDKDNPLGKLVKTLFGVAAGGAYAVFCLWVAFVSEMDMTPGLIIIFAPLLLIFVLSAFVKK